MAEEEFAAGPEEELPWAEEPWAEELLEQAAAEVWKQTESDKQNAQFTEIVQAFKTYYQRKSADNHFYKRVFFWVVIALLLLIAAGFAWACIDLIRHAAKWEIVVPIAGGGAVTLVTALLKLPEIIATHLFPLEEDRVIVDLVTALKDTDR